MDSALFQIKLNVVDRDSRLALTTHLLVIEVN